MRLEGRIVSIEALTSAERRDMLALMQRHFYHVSPAEFDRDFNEKQWAIVVRERVSGAIAGFSTQMLIDANVGGRAVRALFSGDTIVDRAHWGDPMLSHLWGSLALSLIDAAPDLESFWFLISQGYRTYRFLPLFFHEFFPRHDVVVPFTVKQVIDELGRAKFGPRYDAESGIVRANASHYRLCDELAEVPESRLADPHVRFFVGTNRGHASGDELCCLAPLSRKNFTPAAWRVIGRDTAIVEEAACRFPHG